MTVDEDHTPQIKCIFSVFKKKKKKKKKKISHLLLGQIPVIYRNITQKMPKSDSKITYDMS